MVKGTVRADSRAPGGYEMDVSDAQVLHEVHDYPITRKNTVQSFSWTTGTCGCARDASMQC